MTQAAPFKQWSKENLKLAIKAVKAWWTIRRASEEFGVPKSSVCGWGHEPKEIVSKKL